MQQCHAVELKITLGMSEWTYETTNSIFKIALNAMISKLSFDKLLKFKLNRMNGE